MIIGYEGYSSGNTGIADRRRILYWAKVRGHLVVESRDPRADLIVVTSSADLGYWAKANTSVPIILDVVDGLIGEQSKLRDVARGYSYWITRRTSNNYPKSYSELILQLARKCQTVVCSSPEQVDEWSKFGVEAVDILDIHEEVPVSPQEIFSAESKTTEIFWEGLPATLGSMSLLRDSFESRPNSFYTLNLLTNLTAYKYMNKYKRLDLNSYLSEQLPQKNVHINFIDWSPQNLVYFSRKSTLGVIPISGLQGYNHLKAENRLLIMWRLGLPVLTSPLRSYTRVMRDAQIDGICKDSAEWQTKTQRLIESKGLREEFIAKSRIYLEKNHNLGDILAKWDKAIRKE
jgi:hypothetical protein